MNKANIDRIYNLSVALAEAASLADYAQEAAIALAPQKKAITAAEKQVAGSEGHNVGVPCFLPARLLLSLAKIGQSSGSIGTVRGITS